jgi:YaiO family outer membrane protein
MKINPTDMRYKLSIRTCALVFFLLQAGIFSKTFAQTFEEARHFALDGERAKAQQICRVILKQGFNQDVALLLARTYAWDGNYDSTRLILNELLTRYPDNMEALDAFADVEYWSGNYTKAIEYCDLALKKDSVAEAFLFKKARILHSSKKYDEAVATLEKLIQINPAYTDALKKLQEYRLYVLKNSIRLIYTLDYFDKAFDRDPWQITALSYNRKTKFGSVIARVNLAKRFDNSGFQGEIDAYPKISENNYGYLNYGFSQSTIFPRNRMGLEWYHNFPKSFEGSIGMRILYFTNSNVDIYTATLGKYTGNYWISLRSFVTPGTSGTSVSGLLQMRRYFSDPENYFGLRLSYGVSPDDNQNLVDPDLESRLNLKTRSLRLEFNHLFNHTWIFNTGAAWGNEERQSGIFSGFYTFDIGISRLF